MSFLKTRLLVGHVLDRLAELPDASVHCCITSPPYYGLRSYGTEPQVWGGNTGCAHEWGAIGQAHHPGQVPDGKAVHIENAVGQNVGSGCWCACGAWCGHLGLEPTPQLYTEHMVQIFREIRRVLRDDGTLWLNLGDSYSSGGRTAPQVAQSLNGPATPIQGSRRAPIIDGIKPKDLLGIPWMVAFALRDDGWYLRSEIVWSKSAPMPESVTDRPTSAHEKIFLFSKQQKYFYDTEAVKETAISPPSIRDRNSENYNAAGLNGDRFSAGAREYGADGKRNMRNVWHLGPAGFSGAHFATFPPEIPRRAISAGTSEKGVCAQCGAPWRRVVDKQFKPQDDVSLERGIRGAGTQKPLDATNSWEGYPRGITESKTLGWQPTCKHNTPAIPATILDPFFGSGTTGIIAQHLWRSCIGIDLSDKYAQIGRERMPDGLLYQMEII